MNPSRQIRIETLNVVLQEQSAQGLANAIDHAIRHGRLNPGTKLPPIRSVSKAVGLSPATVHAAWAILARSGAIRTDGRRGTVVAHAHVGITRYSRVLEMQQRFRWDLSTGAPDLALLPDLGPTIVEQASSVLPGSYLAAPIVPGLVDALRKTWPYAAESFMIVDGAMDAMELATRGNVRFGDRVIIEDPGFPILIDAMQAAGAQVVGVRMDADGMLAEPLAEALSDRTTAVYLQPRAQNPTGVSLSPARARELAGIIAGTPAVVIEDDSAGGIAWSPAVSLGSWLAERTIHIRSFSKSHDPDLRLAAMSGPTGLIREMADRRQLGQGWTSRFLQRILLGMLTDERTMEAVARARDAYHQRRQAIVAALADRGINVAGSDGFNLWVPVASETAALVYLARQSIGAVASTPFTLSHAQGQHIRLTISRIDKDYDKFAAVVAEAAKALPRMPGR